MKTYKAKSGKTRYKPSIEELRAASADNEGICIACGETQSGVEPDACQYECESCGEKLVYGAEELTMMGHYY